MNNKTGFLFNTDSVSSLVNVMVNILTNHDTVYDNLKIQQKKFIDEYYNNDSLINNYINYLSKFQ